MGYEILRQVSWTAGEIDPKLVGRRDLKAYYSSSASLHNMMPTPQGPVTRRWGTAYVDRVRGPLSRWEVPAVGHTAPNGGDISTVINPGEAGALVSTVDMGTTEPYVVIEIDLGAARMVHLVDLIDYAAVPDTFDPAEPPGAGGDDYPFGRPVIGGDLP